MMKDFVTKKSLGQHFLNSEVVPRWLCDAANIKNGETIVEIGPGTGALTQELLKRGAKVIALEADHRAVEILKEKYQEAITASELTLLEVDVRRFSLKELGLADKDFKIVANIPYYLSGMLFRTCTAGEIQPSCLVFLVQKEVAKRATSSHDKGGKESLLSLSLQVFGKPEYVKSVPRGHFTPSPKVDSAIIAVRNINRNRLKDVDEDRFFDLLHLGLGEKRKQLLGNLSKKYSREKLNGAFTKLNIPLDIRGEDLPLKSWLDLIKVLESAV